MKIAAIQPGHAVHGTFLASQVERRTANNGNEYLRMLLKDTFGEAIVALKFDVSQSEFVTAGTTVEVRGDAQEYRGSINLKITSIERASVQWDAADFIPKSAQDESDMRASLDGFLQRIVDSDIRAVTERVLMDPDVQMRLGRWPAAMRRHHAYIGGLLEHVLELLSIAETLGRLFSDINMDLVYAGCILHDIGKVVELNLEADIDYTPIGTMVGHVVLGDNLVARACMETGCPAETELLLRNIVLSHHGALEWGAPVLPKTPEAVAVHYIDQVSSQVRQAIDAVSRSAPRAPGDPVSQWDRASGQNWFIGTDRGNQEGGKLPDD